MRRSLLMVLALAASITGAEAAEKIYRLGALLPSAKVAGAIREQTLPELAKLGFREGANLVVDERIGDHAAMPRLAQEVVLSQPDAIIATGDAVAAVQNATRTIPIVIIGPDPVRQGWAASYAHPGGNMTGVVVLAAELNAKRLDLLHQMVPKAGRVAALIQGFDREATEAAMRAVAASVGIELLVFEANESGDYPAAFAGMRSAGAQALAIGATSYFYRNAALLARLALDARLPTVCEFAESARSGCLLGYGADNHELRRRMAHQVAQIFRGAAPSDLPIEQPMHYEFAINLKTAIALGLTLPQSLLLRADEVIE